jgi:CBS domain-containing protein
MSTVGEILKDKGGLVHAIDADALVLDAVRVMNDRRIGSVVVLKGREVVGILTERDLLTRVLAKERDPRATAVRDVMTADVFWCTPDMPIDTLRQHMREMRIRHVPVRGADGALCGMVSIGDLNAFQTASLSGAVAYLEEYISRG